MTISKPNSTKLEIILIRHGQTPFNATRVLQGHLDVPLNEIGKSQAELAGKRILTDGTLVDAIWSSDLNRCRQTIDGILKGKNLAVPIVFTADLRERFMGKLQGLQYDEARRVAASEGKNVHAYGESKEAAVSRLFSAWETIIQTSVGNGYKSVLVCSHGGVISKFIDHLINDPAMAERFEINGDNIKEADIKVPHNASFTRVFVNLVEGDEANYKGLVDSFGDTSHLQVVEKVDQAEV
ncbi:phosphoglycerate mutase-like protein [Nadsonia fulvescens var. elongata DSM 6958]|uniref:Phosphoglycerate mutase-like protein n=1 Tax=Nadsonia fulvescens var. elongata DSM 6958 TaxID=857566 RepID=A0A1E3PDI7_9ASCO|nr:phosphoglycerate mutase-like protein [Nadsonia fulvescens var. elongata DSM 6958]